MNKYRKIMSNRSFYIIVLMLISALMFSCSDSNNNPSNDDSPSITSINPTLGYAETEVTINGKNFGAQQGTGFVAFGGNNIPTVKEWSDTKIIFNVPVNAPFGKQKISVTANSFKSNELEFNVLDPSGDVPTITDLSKTIAAPGNTLAIFGKNFGNSKGNSYVELSGTKAVDYPIWTNDRVVITIPDLPENASSVQVVVWVNGVPSNGKDLKIQQKFKLLTMVTIKAGSFTMGDNENDFADRYPAHNVNITKDFDMSVAEITQKEWKTIMDGSNPSHPTDTGDTKPVQQVTFKRALEFCNRLSEAEGYTPVYDISTDDYVWNKNANGYRLPTEAEWEYACRAGRVEDYTNSEVLSMAWVSENAGGHAHPVMQKQPNSWGLYDMLGNVAEWCWDLYDFDYYKNSPENDPSGPATSDFHDRIKRGGSWVNGAGKCNNAYRDSFPGTNDNYNYDLGFRVVRNK